MLLYGFGGFHLFQLVFTCHRQSLHILLLHFVHLTPNNQNTDVWCHELRAS